MKNTSLFLSIVALFLFCSTAHAEKVVVVPLNTDKKVAGTDGQLQYNDDGKTAGAEVYYDKVTKKLESLGEIRTVDESGEKRLWGQGRPGTSLFPHHSHADGYCTTPAGIKFALSEILVSWGSSDAACPLGMWVCSIEDMGRQGCGITEGTYLKHITCSGTEASASTDWLRGWVVDANDDGRYGANKYTESGSYSEDDTCMVYRVWCCW